MRSWGWAVCFVVCWSSGYAGAILAEPAGSMAGVLGWRYLATAVLLVPVVLVCRRTRIGVRDLVQQGVMGLLAHVVFLSGVFAAAGAGVAAGTVALVCALQPLLVTVVSRLCWGDAVGIRQVAGLVVGLGAVFTAVAGGGSGLSGPLLLLPVASLLGLSGAALLDRRWRPDVDVVSGLCIQVSVSAVVFCTYAVVSGQLAIPVTGRVIGAFVWLIVLSGAGGYTAFVMCLRTLGSTTTSLLLYLPPPVTTIWAWAMFGQDVTAGQWCGLLLGAAAVALAWPWGRGRVRHGMARAATPVGSTG